MPGPASGRPSKLNPERASRIVEALRNGATRTAASEGNGIDRTTFLNWMEAGRQAKSGSLFDFFRDVTQAEADAELFYTGVIQKAAEGWDAGERTVTTKTVVERRKMTLGDGTVVDEPVTLELTTVSEVTRKEFDWKAGPEWLKRRRKEWSEKVDDEGATISATGTAAEEFIRAITGLASRSAEDAAPPDPPDPGTG